MINFDDNAKMKGRLIQLLADAQMDLITRVAMYKRVDAMLSPSYEVDEKGDLKIGLPMVFSKYDAIRATLVDYLIVDPIIKYEGTGPEDVIGAALLEKVVQTQCQKNGVSTALDSLISNSLKYNACAGLVSWRKDVGLDGTVLNEGSYLSVIDPYKTFYDSAIPPHRFQDANFIGWYDTISIARLMELIKSGYFQEFSKVRDVINSPSSFHLGALRDHRRFMVDNQKGVVDVITLYANIIPYEFGISESILPEKWLFCLLGDYTIIKAQPLGMAHNKFPLIVCSPDFDDFDNNAVSRMGMLTGMQSLIDWLFSTHIKNTMRATNNRIIVDPLAINLKDVVNNDTFIRVRPSGVGRDIRTMVQQLNITDVTSNFYNDIGQTVSVMETVAGIDATSTGRLRQGGPERLTSQEFIGTLQAAQGRIGRIAKILAQQIFPGLGLFFGYNTQTVMSKEAQVKFTGRWEAELTKRYAGTQSALVSMRDLQIAFDVVAHEGSKTNESSATLWLEVFKLVSSNGMLAQNFDIFKIFKHLIQTMGVKDVESLSVAPMQTSEAQGMPMQEMPQGMPQGDETNRFVNVAEMLGG